VVERLCEVPGAQQLSESCAGVHIRHVHT
jgi:hypothetical protein